MLRFLRAVMIAFFAVEPAWLRDNGWVNEPLAGFLGTLIIAALCRTVIVDVHAALLTAAVLFTVVSILYEVYVDPHGWDLDDALMRVPGMLVALVIAWWVF